MKPGVSGEGGGPDIFTLFSSKDPPSVWERCPLRVLGGLDADTLVVISAHPVELRAICVYHGALVFRCGKMLMDGRMASREDILKRWASN